MKLIVSIKDQASATNAEFSLSTNGDNLYVECNGVVIINFLQEDNKLRAYGVTETDEKIFHVNDNGELFNDLA